MVFSCDLATIAPKQYLRLFWVILGCFQGVSIAMFYAGFYHCLIWFPLPSQIRVLSGLILFCVYLYLFIVYASHRADLSGFVIVSCYVCVMFSGDVKRTFVLKINKEKPHISGVVIFYNLYSISLPSTILRCWSFRNHAPLLSHLFSSHEKIA